MNRRIVQAVPILAVFLFQPIAVAGDTLEAVEKKLVDSWSKIESMTAKLTLSVEMDTGDTKGTTKGEGVIEYMTKDGKTMFRNDMKMTQSMPPTPETQSSTSTVFDGDFIYMLQESMGQKMAFKSKAEEGGYGKPGGKEMFENLRQQNELKLLPDEKVDGKDVYVIEATAKTPTPTGPTTMNVYFHKDTGMMVKMVGIDKSGKAMLTMTYSDMKINPKISPDRFVFKAPEGVTVMDMTGGGSTGP
jgi:outer membrane lipoprotein-sorting protein